MMTSMKYAMGQTVWHASWDSADNYVTCPDCGGTGRLRVIFHDETVASIECRNCAAGYDPPTGRIRVYDRRPKAEAHVITGYEVNGAEVRYRTGHYIFDEDALFETEALAAQAAIGKAALADEEERQCIFKKEKDTRTWAWNASYHRKRIKDAQREIEYHTAKLNVAAIKAKEKGDADASVSRPPPRTPMVKTYDPASYDLAEHVRFIG